MEKYLGVKLIEAEPMDMLTFDDLKGKKVDKDNDTNAAGYKVVYEDGYESWSPKEVFEKAYRRIDNLNFGLALEAMKSGKRVRRTRWGYHGSNIHLELQVPDEHSKMTLPYIFMYKEVDGEVHRFPCDLSCESLLAEDWEVVE